MVSLFFKVPKLELCIKLNWIMIFTCKASTTWPIKLILPRKLYLNLTWFVGWKTCSKPYAYFNENPNKHMKFNKLVKIMEIQGNKLINNVKTWWISILEPTKRVMIDHILVVKMTFDAKMNFKLLCDVDVLYGPIVLLPLLEEVNNLIKLTLVQDVFLVDYGKNQALNVTQIHFVNLYTIFKFDVFYCLKSLVGPSHDLFIMWWILYMNMGMKHLTFVYSGQHI